VSIIAINSSCGDEAAYKKFLEERMFIKEGKMTEVLKSEASYRSSYKFRFNSFGYFKNDFIFKEISWENVKDKHLGTVWIHSAKNRYSPSEIYGHILDELGDFEEFLKVSKLGEFEIPAKSDLNHRNLFGSEYILFQIEQGDKLYKCLETHAKEPDIDKYIEAIKKCYYGDKLEYSPDIRFLFNEIIAHKNEIDSMFATWGVMQEVDNYLYSAEGKKYFSCFKMSDDHYISFTRDIFYHNSKKSLSSLPLPRGKSAGRLTAYYELARLLVMFAANDSFFCEIDFSKFAIDRTSSNIRWAYFNRPKLDFKKQFCDVSKKPYSIAMSLRQNLEKFEQKQDTDPLGSELYAFALFLMIVEFDIEPYDFFPQLQLSKQYSTSEELTIAFSTKMDKMTKFIEQSTDTSTEPMKKENRAEFDKVIIDILQNNDKTTHSLESVCRELWYLAELEADSKKVRQEAMDLADCKMETYRSHSMVGGKKIII